MRGAPGTVLLLVAVTACSGTPPGETREAVVGGQAEAGYPAAGWLAVTSPGQPFPAEEGCGAALIGLDVAVTAAHCIVYNPPGSLFGFSTGAVGSAPVHAARSVIVHPLYDAEAEYPARYKHDVALLLLESPVTDVTPAAIGAASVDPGGGDADPACEPSAIYVGYGRTTVGGPDVPDGYDNERKSSLECVEDLSPLSIFTSGVGGGLCWGDSGGALLRRDSNVLLGVLSDFDDWNFYCDVGNPMVFTNLANHLGFICDNAPFADSCCGEGGCCAVDGQCNPVCAAAGQDDLDCPDTSGPSVTITEPQDGATIAVGTRVVAEITDRSEVAGAELVVDSTVVAELGAPPWQFMIPEGTRPGDLDVRVRAHDSLDNVGEAAITLTVPQRALGEACESNGDCESDLCGEADGEKLCSQACSDSDACPDGFECRGGTACWPSDGSGGGCAVAPGRPASGAGWSIPLALAFALLAALRRRRPRCA